MTPPLVLASSSPFRRMLMKNAGLVFGAQAADIDERAIEAGLHEAGAGPEQVAQVLAREKALAVSRHWPGAFVIGSDQTMSLGDRLYHKPVHLAEARESLLSLSGKTHQLNSGFAIVRDGVSLFEDVVMARLTARPFGDSFIDGYLSRIGDKALTSVGAYQLEGEGIQLFSHIDGDYFTILGLPMLPLLQALRDLGVING
ncbi:MULTISPECIES: Maf-like protein [Rhizobium/Agrobacterium group]|uniref:Maf-like protein n=1 Tax=Rhizobium/Agrobacterium group TaxID=227290 RepID=UPI001AEA12FB